MKSMPRKKQSQDNQSEEPKLPGMVDIENQIKKYVEQYSEHKKISESNIHLVSSILQEYLQTFILIGYNYDGELITHAHSKTQFQSDALNTGLHKFLVQNMVPKPNHPGLPHIDQ